MNKGNRWWIAVALTLSVALLGVAIATSIVRTEGVDGLWKRKRGVVESVDPSAGPVLDKIEERLPKGASHKTD